MATTSTPAESSTSSSSLPPHFYYDVFLSFRGEDTRKNFTDHLYSALVRHGISTFRDNDELKRGEEIGPELLNCIEKSRISVIVFSRNYADSRWCLDELVKILECRSAFQQRVLPVFYDVDPSDVRKQRGCYAKAFAGHEERYEGSVMESKVKRWRAALTEAANLSGWDLQNVADGHESKFIEMIANDLSTQLNFTCLRVTNNPVGLSSRLQRVCELLELGSNDVRMVGIWGIGGIGKTTIAKVTYNNIHTQFEGSSFLADVREISKQPNGLVGLQEQLLSDILMNQNQKIRNVDHGTEVIKQRLWCRKVFVVLDDVSDVDQLEALAIKRDWFHSGSRIIVTTRNKSILKFLEVDQVYESKLLSNEESLQLFSWNAFGRDYPNEDRVELSREVVDCAGRLPLVLEVWGSLFKYTSGADEWKSMLKRLKESPDQKIQTKLRVSYDSLDDVHKNLFLDVACFFVGMETNNAIEILEACDLFPKDGLSILSRQSLVQRIGQRLMMHDRIRDMGREIARKDCLEPGKCRRLWSHKDASDVLKYNTGTQAVEGLVLNLPQQNDVQVYAQALANMKGLRLLQLNYVRLIGSYEHLSKRLKWLCWHGFPSKSIPSNFFMEEVVVLDMPYSKLTQVWKGRKVLNKLKFLNLGHSYHLIETPNFSRVTNLQTLLLNDCTRLVEVQSINCLDKLAVLDIRNCKNLEKLPLGIWKLTSLQNLSLSGCSNLVEVPGVEGSPSSKSWLSLALFRARNPDSTNLTPASTQKLIYLTQLHLANCNLSYLPNELWSLTSLRDLDLRGNNLCTLSASISRLSRLQILNLSHCTKLQSLPELPVNLIGVVAKNCASLESVTIGSNFETSRFLSFSCCPSLKIERSQLQNEEHSAVDEFSIIFPGSEVPDYFNSQSVGSVLSIVVSPLRDRKIRGWILCIVIAGCKDRDGDDSVIVLNWPLDYTVKNKTKGSKSEYSLQCYDSPPYCQDHLWLHYVPQSNEELQMENEDEVEYSVSSTEFRVKKCGVILIYGDVIIDEDVSANQAMADSEGRESVTMETSPVTARGTTGKRKRDGGDKSGRHKRFK